MLIAIPPPYGKTLAMAQWLRRVEEGGEDVLIIASEVSSDEMKRRLKVMLRRYERSQGDGAASDNG